MRHTSVADVGVPELLVVPRYNTRYPVKDTLLYDPILDIVGMTRHHAS